jgi:hypothetical protein
MAEGDQMKKNDWASRFGAARRASDRKLLAEVERQIAAEEQAKPGEAWRNLANIGEDSRAAIARAFGRPLQ